MEGGHVASSSPGQQEDSWTCQRCGWVFPNARPSAKHRRNHRKQCSKIKGLEPQSEVHKGGSSDEVSSDDGSHVNKGTVVHVVEPPRGASQFGDRELLPPETNATYLKKTEAPVHNIVEVEREVPTSVSTRDVDIRDIVKSGSSAAEPLPNIDPCDKTSTTLGEAKELEVNGTPGDVNKFAAAASEHRDPSLQTGSMHEKPDPNYARSMTSLNELSKTLEKEGRGSTDKSIKESQLLEADQLKDTEKLTTTPAEHSINRQGSSLEDDSWTCRRCGWVYPNPHPSAKHRRNHRKHCGKLKGPEVQTEQHKGGSSDEVSSDEEKKGHIQHDIHNESSPIIQGQNSASGLTLAGAAVSSKGQSEDYSTSKDSCAAEDVSGEAASAVNNTPTMMSYFSDSKLIPESVPLASVPGNRAKDEVLAQRDGGLEKTLPFSVDNVPAGSHVTELHTASLDNPGVDVLDKRPMVHQNDKSNPGVDVLDERPMVHDNSSDATIESKSEAIPKGGPSALVRDTPENTLATKANDEVSTSGGALDEISTSGMDKVIERPSITEVPARSLDNSRFDVSGKRPAHLTGDLSLNDDRPVSVLVRDTAEETSGTGVRDEVLRQTDGTMEETSPSSMDNVRDIPGTSTKDEVTRQTDGGIEETSTSSMDNVSDTPGTSTKHEVTHQTDRGTSSMDNVREDMVVERPQVTEKPTQSSDNPRVDFLEERPIAYISGELLSTSDGRAASATIEPKSEVILNGEAPALIRETPEDTLAASARDGVLGQTDRGINEPSTSSMDKLVERPQVTEISTPSLDNRGVVVSEERCIAHTTGELSSSDNNSCPPTMESKSDTFPERGPPAVVGDSVVKRAEDTLATSTRDEVLGQINGRIEETYASIMDKVDGRPPATEMPELSLDNPGVDVSEERHIPHTTGDLSSTDNNSSSTTMESTSDIISEREPPAMVGDPVVTRPEGILATSARDEVLGQTGVDTSTFSMNKVVERPQATEMPTLFSDNPGVDVSEERHIPHTTGELYNSSLTTMELKSAAIPEREPPAMVGDAVVTRPENTLATSAREEVLGQTDGGIEETSTSNIDKVVERPQAVEMHTLASDNPGVDVSEERHIPHTTGEFSSTDNNFSSTTMESKSAAIPEREPPMMVGDAVVTSPEDNPATSARDAILGQTDGGIKDTSTSRMDKVVERPRATEMPTLASDNSGVDFSEERHILYSTGELPSSDNNSSSTIMELKSDAIAEREPPAMVGESVVTRPEDTLTTRTGDEVLSRTHGLREETSTSSLDKVAERPQVTEIHTLSLDSPGMDVSEEKPLVHTAGELSASDNLSSSTTPELKSENIPEKGPPALVGDSLATSTIGNIANNSDTSFSPKEAGLKQSFLEGSDYEGNSAIVYSPLEVSEKPDSKRDEFFEADFGSSGRSLDGTNSFTNAESEFSQQSEFAASSHKLSDSLEIFEDATDTLDACSLGGSVEESESLDEPRQLADGVHEDSKLLIGPLHERVAGAQSPKVIDGGASETKLKPNNMNAVEASSEGKATTMLAGSYAAPAGMDELKAPSPEAWQEPGPSTSAKEGKKVIISEVIEDGKLGESHTALRSLMSMEGKDKMDQAVPIPLVEIDPQSSSGKEASANVKKPKSRSRSFWSHCVCCPAVQ